MLAAIRRSNRTDRTKLREPCSAVAQLAREGLENGKILTCP